MVEQMHPYIPTLGWVVAVIRLIRTCCIIQQSNRVIDGLRALCLIHWLSSKPELQPLNIVVLL